MNPLVAIVCGSDSDLPKLEPALTVLKDFEIPFEVRILSAHRTPEATAEFSSSAESRGIRVIIAAAGVAAHLAGSVAAHTCLPVVAIPIASGALHGMDSLLSTIQMPPGVPVAGVGVDAAKNAGILAAQIIGTGDERIRDKVRDFKKKQAEEVLEKDRKAKENYG